MHCRHEASPPVAATVEGVGRAAVRADPDGPAGDILHQFGGAIHVHNDTPAAPITSSVSSGGAAPILAIVALIVAAVAPRATPFMLPLLGGAIIAPVLRGPKAAIVLWPVAPMVLALAALDVYLAANALWSFSPLQALGRVLLYAAIVGLGTVVAWALPLLTGEDARRLHRGMLIAVMAIAAFLAIEAALGQPIRRLIVSLIPLLRPPSRHMTEAGGWVTEIYLYVLNRNLAVLNFLLWPAFLLMRGHLPRTAARLAAGILLVLTAVAVFSSDHETSMIALAASCLVFAGCALAPRVMRALVIAGWVAATLLVVPAADLAHDAGLHQARWLPQSARNRVELWNVTADRMQASPILGIGIESTKPLDVEAEQADPASQKGVFTNRTGRHSHNIFMQTWFELGAVGAVLLLVVGLAALRAMARLPAAHQPYAFASFVSTIVIASFTWGMWQPWFMCAFGLWAVVLLVGLDAARRGDAAAR
jgi:O-antigen ligase